MRKLFYYTFILPILFFGCKERLDTSKFEVGDVVDEKYSAFQLGSYEEKSSDAYYLIFKGDIQDYELFVFRNSLPCNQFGCVESLVFSLVKDGKVKSGNMFQYVRKDSTKIGTLHDSFITYLQKDEENNLTGLRLTIKNDKVVPVVKLSKEEKTLLLNTLLARYGKTFENPQIQKEFEAKEWYTPASEQEVKEKLSAIDRDLINYLKMD